MRGSTCVDTHIFPLGRLNPIALASPCTEFKMSTLHALLGPRASMALHYGGDAV